VDPMYARHIQETIALIRLYMDRERAGNMSVAAYQALSHRLPSEVHSNIMQHLARRTGGEGGFYTSKWTTGAVERGMAKAKRI
jgi:hypothetical protein